VQKKSTAEIKALNSTNERECGGVGGIRRYPRGTLREKEEKKRQPKGPEENPGKKKEPLKLRPSRSESLIQKSIEKKGG